MNIILMGVKHSGKSTQGRIISEKLGLPFFDTDDVIQNLFGKSAREIYTESGEEGFKEAEVCACSFIQKEVSETEKKKAIIATGGGICCNEKAISLLKKDSLFVFLCVDEEVATERILREVKIGSNGNLENLPAYIAKKNPHTLEDVQKIFSAFFSERQALYQKIADITVSVSSSPKEENAERIICAVREKDN